MSASPDVSFSLVSHHYAARTVTITITIYGVRVAAVLSVLSPYARFRCRDASKFPPNRTLTSVGPEDELREMARSMRQNGTRSRRLVQPHSRDLSTATSGNSSGEP